MHKNTWKNIKVHEGKCNQYCIEDITEEKIPQTEEKYKGPF